MFAMIAMNWDYMDFTKSASFDKMARFRLLCKGAWQRCHVHQMRWLVRQTEKEKALRVGSLDYQISYHDLME